MANYNIPIKIETEDEEYVVQLGENGEYDDDELISPNESGEWADLRDGAGGKLRLKRRRKCGQCGPCQVKENCDKCHFCLRRDVLKQSCIYRKCLYLRKKVPRIRAESVGNNSRSAAQSTSPSSHCTSPDQNSLSGRTDASLCHMTPASPSFVPVTSPGSGSQQVSSDSQRALPVDSLRQIPPDPLRSFRPDPLRTLQQDPLRASSSDHLRSHSVDQVRSLQADIRSVPTDEIKPLPTNQIPTMPGDQLCQIPSDPLRQLQNDQFRQFQNNQLRQFQTDQLHPLGMDQLRSFPTDQYGSVPYGPPRHAWPYSFHQSSNMNMPPGPSCRMTLPEGCRYAMPPQPPFHHHPMSFNVSNLNSNLRNPGTVNHATSSIGPTMNPPFYPPPPVPSVAPVAPVPPSSIPSLPLGQYTTPPQGSYPGGRFPGPHPSMYPANLYPSFRPPNEPYIYHAQFPGPESVFSGANGSKLAYFRDQLLSKTDESDDLKKNFNIFRITKDDSRLAKDGSVCSEDILKVTEEESALRKMYSPWKIDDDLQQQINRVAREGECNVSISIDDYKMQAFIRSDGVNNLEIEIESPVTLSPEASSKDKNLSTPSKSNLEGGNTAPEKDKENEKKEKCTKETKKATISGTVCLKQDLGDEGIMQIDLPGHRVLIEEMVLDDSLIKQSENPSELIKFITEPNNSDTTLEISEDIVLS